MEATTTFVTCSNHARYGLGQRWAYWDAIHDIYYGLSRERVRALYARRTL